MRTTLTLDKEALRAGLDAIDRGTTPRTPFATTGLDLGPSLIGSLDDVDGVLARVEGERHQ